MNRILEKNIAPFMAILLLLAYFVPIAEAQDNTPPIVDDKGSHTRTKGPGSGLYCKLILYEDGDSGIYQIAINGSTGNNIDGTYPDTGADVISGNVIRTWNKKPKKIYIDVCYADKNKSITVKTTARNGDGFDTTKTFINPPKPSEGLLSYGAKIKHGYNVFLTAIATNFGEVIAGDVAYLPTTFSVNNIGGATANMDMRVNTTDVNGTHGLVVTGAPSDTYSGRTIIPADNVGFTVNGSTTNQTENWVYLNQMGIDTTIGYIPAGTTQYYDATLVVPSDASAGNYTGDTVVTFGNSEPAPIPTSTPPPLTTPP